MCPVLCSRTVCGEDGCALLDSCAWGLDDRLDSGCDLSINVTIFSSQERLSQILSHHRHRERRRQSAGLYSIQMSLPASFVESNFRTKSEYEASLALPDSERAAAEAKAAAQIKASSGASSSGGAGPSSAPAAAAAKQKRPTSVIIIGMAGSGKTTLMQRLNAHLHQSKKPYYMVNLDPAVLETPFGAHVDIRDTVNYREVMKQYSLGPNGGILTALNLFATRFDQVLGLIEKRSSTLEYALFDTPGQIEIFTWSASGAIITESLAASFPTVIVYVIDTVRCKNAVTFMSNMLYACSILYKLKLPLVLAFNKVDAAPCDYAHEWMRDLDAFSEALQQERSYMGSLATSMALMLEEFYRGLQAVGVSALTGEGMEAFFQAVDHAAGEYEETYAVELKKAREARQRNEELRAERNREKLRKDGLEAAGAKVVMEGPRPPRSGRPGGGGGGSGGSGGDSSDDDREEDGDDDDPYDNEVGSGGVLAGMMGYNAEDEAWARDHPDEAQDKEEFESLMRSLKKPSAGAGP